MSRRGRSSVASMNNPPWLQSMGRRPPAVSYIEKLTELRRQRLKEQEKRAQSNSSKSFSWLSSMYKRICSNRGLPRVQEEPGEDDNDEPEEVECEDDTQEADFFDNEESSVVTVLQPGTYQRKRMTTVEDCRKKTNGSGHPALSMSVPTVFRQCNYHPIPKQRSADVIPCVFLDCGSEPSTGAHVEEDLTSVRSLKQVTWEDNDTKVSHMKSQSNMTETQTPLDGQREVIEPHLTPPEVDNAQPESHKSKKTSRKRKRRRKTSGSSGDPELVPSILSELSLLGNISSRSRHSDLLVSLEEVNELEQHSSLSQLTVGEKIQLIQNGRNESDNSQQVVNSEKFIEMEEMGLGFWHDGQWIPSDVMTQQIWHKLQTSRPFFSNVEWNHTSRTFQQLYQFTSKLQSATVSSMSLTTNNEPTANSTL